MEDSSAKNALSGYALYLAEQSLLNEQVALNALHQASLNKTSYIDLLVKQKLLSEVQVAKSTAEYFGLPVCEIAAFTPGEMPHEFLSIPLVRKRHGLPLMKNNSLLYIAVADPTNEDLHDIRFLTGLDARLLIVETSKLEEKIDNILNTLILSEINDDKKEESIGNISVYAYKEGNEENADISSYDVESAPIVNYVNRILLEAIERHASDIHFEHYEDNYRIRYRQHGVLRPINPPPLKLASYLLARIKIISNMDITEHRIPQDGRFKLFLSKKKSVDFRVSVCPTLFGEKIVLRILDPTQTFQGLEHLGMDDMQRKRLTDALERSQGMILVTGPTGSGKTVTLYSSLHHINSPEKNISTVEDPVEIPLQGVNQVNVNLKTNLTFAAALRAFLRQDPDVIMVGEIRDLETAEIAIKASQTGHLVLSTLHTNSAPETLVRLVSMGVEPYNLANSLKIIIAQRLVRVLCDLCKKPETIPDDMLAIEGFKKEEIGTFKTYVPVGCDHCIDGYRGRMGIFEVMPVTEKISELIMRNASATDIALVAKEEGVINLRESGLEKVKQGMTSLSELNRVFK